MTSVLCIDVLPPCLVSGLTHPVPSLFRAGRQAARDLHLLQGQRAGPLTAMVSLWGMGECHVAAEGFSEVSVSVGVCVSYALICVLCAYTLIIRAFWREG